MDFLSQIPKVHFRIPTTPDALDKMATGLGFGPFFTLVWPMFGTKLLGNNAEMQHIVKVSDTHQALNSEI